MVAVMLEYFKNIDENKGLRRRANNVLEQWEIIKDVTGENFNIAVA